MILFISDLHLHPSQPETAQAFLDFLAGPARGARELWILGDLFEFWIGDDDLREPFNARIADALAALGATGVTTRLIVGNRDFLLGRVFAARSGVQLVPEPAIIELGAHRVVLLHGDAQCTDDLAYQRFRRKVRNPFVQTIFGALPRALRSSITAKLRARSAMEKSGKQTDIMDVNADAIASVFRDSGAEWMIHGHTHRPAHHTMLVEGRERQRWVLPDWNKNAVWLEFDDEGTLQMRKM